MTIKTQVHTCRKCQSEDLVKNGTNASGSPLYHCKTCGTYGVLEPKQRYSEEEKEIIRVVPLDNFMIYKDIIRLDRPD